MKSELDHVHERALVSLAGYVRFLRLEDASSGEVSAARMSLLSALSELSSHGSASLEVFFADRAVLVAGRLLRGGRSSYEAGVELGRLCRRIDATSIRVPAQLSVEDLLAIEEPLAAYLREEGPAPDAHIEFFADDLADRGLELEEGTDDQVHARLCASIMLVVARLLELDEKVLRAPTPALKHAAQALCDLDISALLRLFRANSPGPDQKASRARHATQAALLASAMARVMGLDRDARCLLIVVSLLLDVGVKEPAASPFQTPERDPFAPERAAAVLTRTTSPRPRLAVLYEARALLLHDVGDVDEAAGSYASIVYLARIMAEQATKRETPRETLARIEPTLARFAHEALRVLWAAFGMTRPASPSFPPDTQASVTLLPTHVEEAYKGVLSRTPFPHVLVFMLEHRLSGTITFDSPTEGRARVYFVEGVPSLASDVSSSKRLGDILVEHELARRDVVEHAARFSREAGVLLGESLVGDGHLLRPSLERALASQLVMKVAGLANLSPDTHYEYFPDENLLFDSPSGSEPLFAGAFRTLTAAVRTWRDRSRLERLVSRLAGTELGLQPETAPEPFGFSDDEGDVFRRIEQGSVDLGTLLRESESAVAVETVVAVLFLTRHLRVGHEQKAPISEPAMPAPALESSRLDLPDSDEDLVERMLGGVAEQRKAEEAVLRGDLDTAEVHASEAAKKNPDDIENRILMAWLRAQQDPDLLHEAGEVALELLERDPSSEFGMLYYARVCRDLGKHGEARRIFRDLLKLYPQNEAAKQELAAL